MATKALGSENVAARTNMGMIVGKANTADPCECLCHPR
jgi:hypothetical protein